MEDPKAHNILENFVTEKNYQYYLMKRFFFLDIQIAVSLKWNSSIITKVNQCSSMFNASLTSQALQTEKHGAVLNML